jgi:hypothetical protein
MNVGYSGIGLTKEFNFENIYRSVLTLFPLCTSGGFSVLLDSLTHEAYPFCEPNNGRTNASYFTNGNCGRSSIAIPFLVSYVVIAFFVVINLYVAIILENFDKAKEELQKGKITEEDLDHYYQVWQIFDPRHPLLCLVHRPQAGKALAFRLKPLLTDLADRQLPPVPLLLPAAQVGCRGVPGELAAQTRLPREGPQLYPHSILPEGP